MNPRFTVLTFNTPGEIAGFPLFYSFTTELKNGLTKHDIDLVVGVNLIYIEGEGVTDKIANEVRNQLEQQWLKRFNP